MNDSVIKSKFDLPDVWKIEKLENLTSQIIDGTHFTPVYTNSGIPFLRVTDIQKKEIDKSKLKFISRKEHELLIKRCNPKKGDILLSKNGTVGIPKKVDWEWEFSIFVSLSLIKIKSDLLSDYLIHFLKSDLTQWQIKRRSKQGTVTNLHLEEIRELEVPYLNFKTQQKIAKILSTCDKVIERTEQAIAKYEAIKKGLMHDLFTRGIDPATNQLRPKYEDAPELYKKTELGWIPREWYFEPLSNLSNLITDGAHFSPVPKEEGLPIGNVKDMLANKLNFDSCTKISSEDFLLLSKQNCQPKVGDVLLSKDGTVGKVIYFQDQRPIVLLSSIAIIRVNDKIISEFLAVTLKTSFFDKNLFKLLSGSALKRITLKDIQQILLPYPKSKEEQRIINEKIKSADDKLLQEQSTLSKYQKIKAGLMQDLLTGKVSVSVSE